MRKNSLKEFLREYCNFLLINLKISKDSNNLKIDMIYAGIVITLDHDKSVKSVTTTMGEKLLGYQKLLRG